MLIRSEGMFTALAGARRKLNGAIGLDSALLRRTGSTADEQPTGTLGVNPGELVVTTESFHLFRTPGCAVLPLPWPPPA
jgi:hypothetical protein